MVLESDSISVEEDISEPVVQGIEKIIQMIKSDSIILFNTIGFYPLAFRWCFEIYGQLWSWGLSIKFASASKRTISFLEQANIPFDVQLWDSYIELHLGKWWGGLKTLLKNANTIKEREGGTYKYIFWTSNFYVKEKNLVRYWFWSIKLDSRVAEKTVIYHNLHGGPINNLLYKSSKDVKSRWKDIYLFYAKLEDISSPY